jgi:hypothetical protein
MVSVPGSRTVRVAATRAIEIYALALCANDG